MKTLNQGELACVMIIFALGVGLLWEGRDLAIGQLRRIGPGFMPRVVGWALLALSVGLFFEALRIRPQHSSIPFRPILLVMAGIGSFAVVIERLGMVPAIFGLTVLSALAERPFDPLRTLLLATGISVLGVVLFIYALGLPLDPFVW